MDASPEEVLLDFCGVAGVLVILKCLIVLFLLICPFAGEEGVWKLGRSFRKCSHAKIESEVLKCWTADSSTAQAWMLTMKESSSSCGTGKVEVCVGGLELWREK